MNPTDSNDSQPVTGTHTNAQGWKPHVRRPRVALSCQVCKMRKVRCDRRTPVCRRCANGGFNDLCIYEHDNARPDPQHAKTHNAIVAPPPTPQRQRFPPSHVGHPSPPPTNAASGSELISASVPSLYIPTDIDSSFEPLDQTQRHCSLIPATEQVPVLHAHLSPPTFATDPMNDSSLVELFPSATDFPSTPSALLPYSSPSEAEIVMRGVGFETTFAGSTSSISTLAYFPHFVETMNNITMNYVSTTTSVTATPPELPRPPRPVPLSHLTSDGLHALFPPRFRCHQLMRLYLKHYDLTFRILHPPIFWQQYNEFWNLPMNPSESMPYIILAAMSCARCIERDSPVTYDGDSSTANREAMLWSTVAKQWSDEQGLKHTTLEFFQLKCLILLSQKLNIIKIRSHYPSSQTLLAIAMGAALHRSVDCLSYRTTFYEREMRRRIWWAITELELAECIERGLPSLVQNLNADNEPPSNILDADLTADTTFPPTHHPENVFTESSFARHGKIIQSLRHRVNTIANHAPKHRTMTPAEVNSLHEEIIARLNYVLSTGSFQPANNDSNIISSRAILELYLHELLLILHLPLALGPPGQPSQPHSRFVCQGSARSTIELFAGLEEIGISHMSLPRSYLQRAILALCRMDMLTLARSQYYSLSTPCVSRVALADPPFPDPIYSPSIDPAAAVALTLKTFDMYEDRILTRGDGVRGFWLIFIASCYLRQHQEGQAATAWREKISSRIISLCSKMSMSQSATSQSEQHRDAVFARYMKHLQRTGVFAGFEPTESLLADPNRMSVR